jgi:hypothetical protein
MNSHARPDWAILAHSTGAALGLGSAVSFVCCGISESFLSG